MWFNGLSKSVKPNSDQLFTKFKEHFSGLHPTWMLKQHLYELFMLPSESLEVDISAIEKRCSRLCKTDRETTTAFIRGLPGSLHVFVIQRDPKYFKDAVQSVEVTVYKKKTGFNKKRDIECYNCHKRGQRVSRILYGKLKKNIAGRHIYKLTVYQTPFIIANISSAYQLFQT